MYSAAIANRPRARLCQKSFDGTAAVQVMLLQQAVGRGHQETIEVAAELLEYGFPVSDLQRLTGLNRTMLRRLSAALGRNPSERVGRIPSSLAPMLDTPQRRLWISVFLNRLSRFRKAWEDENKTFVSGRAMLAAIRSAELACGPFPASTGKSHVRYLLLAAEQLCSGTTTPINCGPCGTRFVRFDLDCLGSAAHQAQRCPLCEASGMRKTGTSRTAPPSPSTRHRPIPTVPSMQVSPDWATRLCLREIDTDPAGRAASTQITFPGARTPLVNPAT